MFAASQIDRTEIQSQPAAASADLKDLRFRALLDEASWSRLPPDVKRRFSKRLAQGESAVYTGRVTKIVFSRVGYLLAQAMRLLGSPLPLSRDCGVPAVVAVTGDARSGGQIWTRCYGNLSGFPQVIHSAKRFSGPTGLEEHIGFGISVALMLSARRNGLVFSSAHYDLTFGRIRIRLPRWLSPELTVTHEETQAPHFLFTLELAHPILGTLIRQEAAFTGEMS
jgi:hypothetical protein